MSSIIIKVLIKIEVLIKIKNIMAKAIRRRKINFDDFAQWYIGGEIIDIINYFEDEVGIDVRPYIGKQIIVDEIDRGHVINYTSIDDENFDIDAVESYFDYLDNK